ncbi:helix-turn-helix domain-containing protein, partial [Dysosmobacter welbionis]
RRHRHGGPALHHADGASPLVSADGHRRQRTQRRETLRRGGGGPLGPGRPHAGGGQKSGGPGRGAGRGAAG